METIKALGETLVEEHMITQELLEKCLEAIAAETVEKDEKRTSVKFLSKAARFFTVGASGLAINYLASMIFSINSKIFEIFLRFLLFFVFG